MTTYVSSTVMEMMMAQNVRELERKAEERRRIGELVHTPGPIRRELARLRTFLYLDAIPDEA